MTQNQIGSNIRKARVRLGYTQAELAKEIKVSRMTISRYETGFSEISIKQLEKISKVLKTSLVDLLMGSENLTNYKRDKAAKNEYVVKIDEYETKCARLNGFSKPAQLGLAVPSPMRVVKDSAFRYYLKHRGFPKLLIREVKNYFKQARDQNPHRGIFIGRGYYVPGIESPPGPRTGAIYDVDEYIASIEKFYDYAIDNNYNIEGSDIAIVLHPFIHPYNPPLQENPEIAYPGGAVVPTKSHKDSIIIESIWGHDEAIQTLPHDTFVVDFKKKIIIEKKIQSKETALKVGKRSKYEEILVAPSHKTIQTLNDQQILQIAEDYKKIFEKFGSHRIEFILQPEGIVYRECTPFAYAKSVETVHTDAKGRVCVIKTQKDIDRLDETVEIVSIHRDVIKSRSMDILTTLALRKEKRFIILYPGSATTAHSATIFREQGHTLVYVRDQMFENGDIVEISIKNGELTANIISQSSSQYIINFNFAKRIDHKQFGTKALKLFEISRHGIQIPETIVISTEVFMKFIRENEIDLLIQKLNKTDDSSAILDSCKKIQNSIAKVSIPDCITAEITKAASVMGKKQLSVRSSATCEDSDKASFAGQFDSYLNVNSQKLIRNVKKVWASTFNVNAVLYAKNWGFIPSDLCMAVILQEMIDAKKAGVVFTENINNGKRTEMVIEAANGLGDKIVDGSVAPDRIVVKKKSDGNFQIAHNHEGENVLSQEEIRKIFEISREIEELYHCSQDIEWAIDSKDELYILQTRPITTNND